MKTEWQNSKSKATENRPGSTGRQGTKNLFAWRDFTMKREFFNHRGKCFASVCGDVLKKSEREGDRLRITGGRAYAIDADVLLIAQSQGAKFLEIHEKTFSNDKRVFKIPISDIYCFGQEINIKGIERWTIPLEACSLVEGDDESWRIEAMQALKIKGELSEMEKNQLSLFVA